MPLAAHKTEGPTTCITLLGIEIDSVVGELRLPPAKLQRAQELLHEEGMHQARAGVTNRHPQSCMQAIEARTVILMQHDKPAIHIFEMIETVTILRIWRVNETTKVTPLP